MSLYKNFQTDKTAEKDGKWFVVAYTDDGKEISFLLARAGMSNTKFTNGFNRYVKPKNTGIRNEIKDLIKQKQKFIKLYSETIVLDWKNVEDENGKKLPFSVENVEKVLTDLPDLFDVIVEYSNDMESFRKENIQEESKSL